LTGKIINKLKICNCFSGAKQKQVNDKNTEV
jgi:hypothetical protein